MRKVLVLGLTLVFLLGGAAVAVAAYDHAHRDLIAPGVKVAGVPVGNLHADAARAKVPAALHRPLSEPIVVRSRGRRWTLPASKSQAAVDVDSLVDKAVNDSRQGSVVTRTVHGLTGKRVSEDIPARVTYSQPAVDQLIKRVKGAV